MTNGFDLTKVLAALGGRVGWKQPAAAGAPTITGGNTTTKSGRFFQDFHSLVTVSNIKATMEEPNASDANLNAHLATLANGAILRVLDEVFRTKDFIEHSIVANITPDQSLRTISNDGNFVGFEIIIAPAMDITSQIDTLQLFFDTEKTFDVYIFAEHKKLPLLKKSVTASAGDITIVQITEEVLLQFVSDTYQGNRFFIGYFQDDLSPAKAYQKDACFPANKTFSARPFQAKKTGSETFDRQNINRTAQIYGMNLEISSFRNHTNTILKNPAIFDTAIGLQVANMVIESIINTTQSNAKERILKDTMATVGINLELNGVAPISDSPKVKGLKAKLDDEFKRLRTALYPAPKTQIVTIC